MALKNGSRFTVYDAMEAEGRFSANPANADSRDKEGRALYVGPVKFPMMLYHPQGREMVISPGQRERTSYGTVETFNEQWAIVTQIVSSEDELALALSEGWHKHPVDAIRVANDTWRKEEGLRPFPVPAKASNGLIADLEEQNRKLTALLEEARREKAKADEEGSDPPAFAPSRVAGSAARAGLT